MPASRRALLVSLGLSACVPPGALPSPAALAEPGASELGAFAGTWLDRVPDCVLTRRDDGIWREDCPYHSDVVIPTFGVYGAQSVRERVDVGVLVGGGWGGLTAGAWGRHWWIDQPAFRLGGQLEGGVVWAGVGVPMSLRVHRGLWLTSSPRLAANLLVGPEVELPLGATVKLPANLSLSAQASYHVLADGEVISRRDTEVFSGVVSVAWSAPSQRQDAASPANAADPEG